MHTTTPRARADAAHPDRDRDSRESAAMTEPSTVFVVDDDAAVLRSIERLLRVHGFTVRPFTSPGAFLRAIDPATPGCVLLDLSLPEVTGLDVQKQLVANGNHQPVVFLSGYGTVSASVQ